MSYCNRSCQYLDEKKHKCILTGEKLTRMKYSGAIEFEVYEHKGFCKEDGENNE